MILYQLILHDFGNLQYKVIHESLDKSELLEIADNINFLMGKAVSKQFEACVDELELGEIDENS